MAALFSRPASRHVCSAAKGKQHINIMANVLDEHERAIFLDAEALKQPPSSFTEPDKGNATWHTLVSSPSTPSTSLSAGIATCPAKGSLALHRHKQAEIYHILSGTGEVEVDGKRRRVSTGMTIWVPGNAEHGVFCGDSEELRWFYVFPEGSFEDVVYRFTGLAQ